MSDLFSALLTGLLAFSVADYTLGRARVSDPVCVVVAAVFAVLTVVLAGVLALTDIVN